MTSMPALFIGHGSPMNTLERNGYTHVLHFAGGLQEWEQAGYPLEGQWVKEKGDE